MQSEIPPDARIEQFTLIRDLDIAACYLCEDQSPQLPDVDASVFIENASRIFVFKFPPTAEITQIKTYWEQCRSKGAGSVNGSPVGYIYSAFRNCDRLSVLIREGRGARRPSDTGGNFWTVTTKAAAAALAVAKAHDLPDERLERMICWDGTQAGFLLRGIEYIEAFQDPVKFCGTRPPQDPLALITAGFFFRERLRDLVNRMPARHVFRDPDDPTKISFIAEPQTS